MVWVLIFSVSLDSFGADFTAAGFCRSPQEFICAPHSLNDQTPEIRLELARLLDQLKAKYPSVKTFIESSSTDYTNPDNFDQLGRDMEADVARRLLKGSLAVIPALGNIPLGDISIQMRPDEISRLPNSLSLREGLTQIPNSIMRPFFRSFFVYYGSSSEFSAAPSPELLELVVEEDPALQQFKRDFQINPRNPFSIEDSMEEFLISENSALLESELARQNASLPLMATYVRQAITEAGIPLTDEQINTPLQRHRFVSPASGPMTEAMACSMSGFLGSNAVVNPSSGEMSQCPGDFIRNRRLPHSGLHLKFHEMGHNFDIRRFPQIHEPLAQCLNTNYGNDLTNASGTPLSSLSGDPEQRMDLARQSAGDWIADDIAASSLVQYFQGQEVSRQDALRVLRREYRNLCASHQSGGYDPHIHPPPNTRLNIILGGNSAIRQFFGCNSVEGAVAANQCPLFRGAPAGQGTTPPPTDVDSQVE